MGGVRGAQPLVLVHPVGGTLFCYLDLLEELGASFEIFGVQGDLLGVSGTTDIAVLAERYAAELAVMTGDRRPVIVGWSAGGIIAHEIGGRLDSAGLAVDRLVLIDTHPQREAGLSTVMLKRLREAVARQESQPLLAEANVGQLLDELGVDPGELAKLDGPTTESLMAFWVNMLTGLASHLPTYFDGRADLIVSSSGDEKSRRELVGRWREWVGQLTVTYVDGEHSQLLRRPWATAVAEVIRGSSGQAEV
jgi:thioesterase domain-containing protein